MTTPASNSLATYCAQDKPGIYETLSKTQEGEGEGMILSPE